MQTMTLGEAAEFLKMSSEALRVKAKNKQIPGAKLGKRWVFIREDLEALLRGGYDQPRQASQKGDDVCPSMSEATRSGVVSQRQAASAILLIKP